MTIMQTMTTTLGALLGGMATFFAILVATPYWDLAARKHLGDGIRRIEQLGSSRYKINLGLRLWGIATIVTFVGLWWGLRMPPVALAVTWLVYVSAGLIIDALIQARTTLFRDQMVSACQSLASAVKSHLSLAEGLESVAVETPMPLSLELRRIVFEFKSGRPLERAIAAAQQRLQIPSFSLFATTLQIAVKQGGRVNDALVRIGRCLQENQRLERKVQADTASGRRVVQILAVFPIGFLLLFHCLEPEVVDKTFVDFYGQCALAAAIIIDYAGVRMASKMMRINI